MGQQSKLAWRSIWRNRRRTIITVVSIAFSLALAVFFVSFAEGMYAKLIDDAVRMQAGHMTVEHADYHSAPAVDLVVDDLADLRQKIGAIDGVERTKAMVVGQGVAKSGQGAIGIALAGVEPSTEAGSSPLATKLMAGSYLADDDLRQVVIGSTLARRLKLERKKDVRRMMKALEPIVAFTGMDKEALFQTLKIHLSLGKKVVIASNNVDGDMVEELVRVKGIFHTGAVEIDGFFVQVPIRFARKLYGMSPGQATQLGVLVDDVDDRDAIMDKVRELVSGGQASTAAISSPLSPVGATAGAEASVPSRPVVRPWEEVLPDLAAYIKVDGGSNYVFQGILIFLVMFTIFNTILMSVMERRREFAVLLALGTPPGRLKIQIMLETSFIALIGVFWGLLIGGLAGLYFQVNGMDLTSFYPDGMSVSGFAVDPVIYALVTPTMLLVIGGIVFGSTLLLSLYPMGRIDRIPVADLLR